MFHTTTARSLGLNPTGVFLHLELTLEAPFPRVWAETVLIMRKD